MKTFNKIAGINLLILLGYSSILRLAFLRSTSNDRAIGIALFSAILIGIQLVVCVVKMIVGFANGNGESGRNWLAAAGIVLLVGFSVCFGNASLG